MAKLTKPQIKAHLQALEYLKQDRLKEEEREFVFDNWQESANHVNSAAGAFFTPLDMAWTFELEVGGPRVLDLCAGIGVLSYAVYQRRFWINSGPAPQITCVEINPDYAAIGQKLLPEATWIIADAMSDLDIGRFDWVISNPPFGRLNGIGDFDLAIVERAERYADNATFILPAGSVPWAYSGRPGFEPDSRSEKAKRFRERTKIDLTPNCGIDCSAWASDWRGAAPKVEIALADYAEARSLRTPTIIADHHNDGQFSLFGAAA